MTHSRYDRENQRDKQKKSHGARTIRKSTPTIKVSKYGFSKSRSDNEQPLAHLRGGMYNQSKRKVGMPKLNLPSIYECDE